MQLQADDMIAPLFFDKVAITSCLQLAPADQVQML